MPKNRVDVHTEVVVSIHMFQSRVGLEQMQPRPWHCNTHCCSVVQLLFHSSFPDKIAQVQTAKCILMQVLLAA